MNEFQWRVRVTSGAGDTARVSARRHQFTVGRPLDFDAEYGHLTALEHVLGAVGAEIVSGLRVFARRRRLEIDDVEAVVDGALDNPLTYLEVVGESGDPGLARLAIRVFVASPHDEATVRRLWDDTLARLPLARTLGAAGRVALRLELTVTG
jgi:hypothetical protein